MAIYRLEVKIISREKRGRSVVAAAAYRTGTKLHGEREAKMHDYSRRAKGVMATTILTPEGAPDWTRDSQLLWNGVEAAEKRADAALAREFILAVPNELSADAQFQLAVDWSRRELVSNGMVVQVCLHHPQKGANAHVHVLCTTRRLDGENFSAKKARDWDKVEMLLAQRGSWADSVNAALEKVGSTERVDHRSLKARGIDQIPQPKIGVAATAMEKRGVVQDSTRRQEVRFVKLLNEVMPHRRAIERGGEVKQMGVGATWWEKSAHFLNRVKETARETVLDAWRSMLEPWKRARHDLTPPPQTGQDISR